jgi:hypothetical protein
LWTYSQQQREQQEQHRRHCAVLHHKHGISVSKLYRSSKSLQKMMICEQVAMISMTPCDPGTYGFAREPAKPAPCRHSTNRARTDYCYNAGIARLLFREQEQEGLQ